MAQRGRGRRGRGRGNLGNFGEDVGDNPPFGRNMGQQPPNNERDEEMAEIRRQIAALTEMVRRWQPPHEEDYESSDVQSHFENPFGVFPRERPRVDRFEPRMELNFKAEIPEFQGSLKPDDFVDWLDGVERIFDYYEVNDEKKVKLVAIRLKGSASAWWEHLQAFRLRNGKGKIKSWEKMKKKLREQFLPFNYTQSLYKSLHNLKQEGSVEEYTMAFYQLISRVDLNESDEQKVARYLSGLKTSIQDVLGLHSLWNVAEAYNRALLVEKQQMRGYSRAGQQQTAAGRTG